MPTVDAYRRAPLANPAFVPFSDGALQVGGLHGELTQKALAMADIAAMTPLDAVLASKLGGYAELPPVPNAAAAATEIAGNPHGFVLLARAALMCAAANHDKETLLRLLTAMEAFRDRMGEIPEEALTLLGADALRLTSELYRRTGMSFLLDILEELRGKLPDISGLMHSFPFIKAYQVQDTTGMDETSISYHQRMQAFATGTQMADALAMTAHLALFSGSRRDSSAAKAGLSALMRYHGVPTGAFAADPLLAGRDPARATDLRTLCAQIEAYCDLLAASGDLALADRLDMLLHSALPDFFGAGGIRALQPINRLSSDDSCETLPPEPPETTALLRALYALRRSVWMAKENDEIALLLPMDGGCLTRVNGAPVRITARTSGTLEREVTLSVETRQPTSFTLLIRVPSYAAQAWAVIGGREQSVQPGTLFAAKRTFRNGDTLTLRLRYLPKIETGYRGSLSVTCGPHLMALPCPEGDEGWQFGLLSDGFLTAGEEHGVPQVVAAATEIPGWQAKNGFITPPPQGASMGAEYRLTLLPFATTRGRVAAFPQVTPRA